MFAGAWMVAVLSEGRNDLSFLKPGIYFALAPSPQPSPPQGERMKERGSLVTKVVIQR